MVRVLLVSSCVFALIGCSGGGADSNGPGDNNGPDDNNGADAATGMDMNSGSDVAAPGGPSLWTTPGAPGTASAEAAEALEWCEGEGLVDGVPVRIEYTGGAWSTYVFSASDADNYCTYIKLIPAMS